MATFLLQKACFRPLLQHSTYGEVKGVRPPPWIDVSLQMLVSQQYSCAQRDALAA